MLQARSHFADKENAHGSTSLYPKTPARGLSAGTRDPNLLAAGSKTVGRGGLTGKPGMGGGDDNGNIKLTMTTRTGKGKEKMQGGGGGKGGKGGGDEGEGIEPKRLFTNLSKAPGTTKKASSSSTTLPTSKSLTFSFGPSASTSQTNTHKTPALKRTLAPTTKTPAPVMAEAPVMATPLPSATRARRRSRQSHTPVASVAKDAAMSTPEGKGGIVADVSFEMEDGGVEAMMLGGVTEGVEEDEDDCEVEYMPPTAYIEPFSLPYEVTSAKVLGEQIRSLPPLVFWPTDDEDHALPEVEIGEEQSTWQVPLKSIDSDDELDLGLPKKIAAPIKPSAAPAPGPSAVTARRAPISAFSTRPSSSTGRPSSTPITKRPVSSSTTRPASSATATASRPSSRPAPPGSAPAIRKGLSTTTSKPSSLLSARPTNVRPATTMSASKSAVTKPTPITAAVKPTPLARKPLTTTSTRPVSVTGRAAVISRPGAQPLRAPIPRDLAAERKRREDEGRELSKGLDEFAASLDAPTEDLFAGFEIEEDAVVA